MTIYIVSGSRYATEDHFSTIEAAFLAVTGGRPLVKAKLVHGDAQGVDRLAAAVVEQWGWDVAEMPAQWQRCDDSISVELGGCPPRPHLKQGGARGTYCPYAGPRRNQLMLDTFPDADMALCFPGRDRGSKSGTGDFIDRAIRAGLIHMTFPLDLAHPQAPLFAAGAGHSPA